MRIAFKTFGCKANSVDTDSLYMEAQRRGFLVVDENEVADAYLINSCTVTAHADRDARAQVSRFKRLNPNALVGVVGCYAQVAREELLAIPEINFVVGTAEKYKMLDHFRAGFVNAAIARDQVSATTGFMPEIFLGSRYARASIKIQDGCNFKCSFCIIPEARGRSRSLSDSIILDQINEAYAQGFREVVLTGIHLAHYGWDRGSDLMGLLKQIFAQLQIPRVRLSTLDPFEIPDELVALLSTEPRLCPHFHIALQSGSDKILARMRRIYKSREFVTVTQKIGRANPRTFIGVDVIVGFPGETDEDFDLTVACLEKSYWTKLHVFPFSLRKGTRAELLPDHVPSAVIHRRAKILRDLSDRRRNDFLEAQVESDFDVVLERPYPKSAGVWLGHTENYLPTRVAVGCDAVVAKSIIRSKIIQRDGEWVSAVPC